MRIEDKTRLGASKLVEALVLLPLQEARDRNRRAGHAYTHACPARLPRWHTCAHTPHAACYPACRWLLYARTHTRGTEALGRAARVQRNWATRNLKGGHIKERLGALLARIRAIRREVLQQLCVRVDGPLVVVRAAGSLYSPSTPILLSSPAAPGSAS